MITSTFARIYVALIAGLAFTIAAFFYLGGDFMHRTDAKIFLSDGRYFANQFVEHRGKSHSLYKQLESTGKQQFYVFDLALVEEPVNGMDCQACRYLFEVDGMAVYKVNGNLYRAYYPLPNSKYHLRFTEREDFFEPQFEWYEDSEIMFVITFVMVMILVLAAMVYLYVQRLHGQIVGLNAIQKEFGKGRLSSRASEPDFKLPVRDLAYSFNTMAADIEHRVKQNHLFTQAIPHELRTPLSRIQLASDLARRTAPDSDQVLFDDIDSYVEDIAGLTDSLVTLSRLNTLTYSVELVDAESVDLCKLIEQRVERLGDLCCAFQFNVSDSELTVSTTFFNLVIDNLLQNAVRYGKGALKVTLTECDQHYVLDVEDNGDGVPEDKRQEIFMAFARLDKSRNRDHNGFGLGLTIVRNVCHVLKWPITVGDSALGGARFSVLIAKS